MYLLKQSSVSLIAKNSLKINKKIVNKPRERGVKGNKQACQKK